MLKLRLERILEAWARSCTWVVSDAESGHGVCVAWGSSGSCLPGLCGQLLTSAPPLRCPWPPCCRKGDPFQGPREGACLTPRNELSKETHMRTEQETIGKGRQGESSRVKGPGRLLCHVARSLRFYGDAISFWVVFGQSLWIRVLPSCRHIVQPRLMPARRILGSGRTRGISFWPFPNPSGWWRFMSSAFLTRISCKIIHADGYYGAWPVSGVSVSVLPLTSGFFPRPFNKL